MNTYSQLYVHLVWSTKGRMPWIRKTFRDSLYKYICGIARSHGAQVIGIGGIEDHLHLLVVFRPSISICDLVRELKAGSSKWINELCLTKERFSWQTGYGAFTVNQSSLKQVKKYIENQETHHLKRDFKSEFVSLLQRHRIGFDSKHIFD